MDGVILKIILFLGGISISIISYFLKNTMNEIKEIKEISYKNRTKIEVIEIDYLNKIDNLNGKFEQLYKAIDKLTDKIEKLNDRI